MAGRNRLEMYKKRGGVVDVKDRRQMLAAQRRDAREQRRTAAFTAHRGLGGDEKDSRQKRFEQWKKQKELQKKAERASKPAFVIKKISYNDSHLYKPPESFSFQPPKGLQTAKTVQVDRPIQMRTRLQQKASENAIKEALKCFVFEPPCKKVNAIKLKNEREETTDKQTKEKRGKATSSKLKEEMKEEISDKEVGNMTTIFNGPRTSASENKNVMETVSLEQSGASNSKPAEYFRALHDNAVTNLNDLCSKWTNLKERIPNVVHDKVDVAVGYAHLLIAQKLLQFQNLIIEHEKSTSLTELKVLSTDLEGFWSLVCREVDDVNNKFKELKEMKENNWQEAREICLPTNFPRLQRSKTVKPKGTATSGLRSFLAQARRAKAGDTENSNSLTNLLDETASLPKHMSPVVMRVSLKAKQIGSPRAATPSVPNARTPLRLLNMPDHSSRSAKRTPLTEICTPASVRRSSRLSKKVINEL